MNFINAIDISKFIQDWIAPEASIAIADQHYYVDYISGIHDIQIHPGQSIPSGSISARVLLHKERVESMVNESVFGISYYGVGFPIDNQLGFRGALTVILPPSYLIEKQPPLSYITGKKGEIWCPIPVEEIAYIESHQKKTWFYTLQDKYSTVQSLRILEKRLPDSFLRIHRSFIVNIAFIQHLYRDLSSNLLIRLKIPGSPELTVSQTYVPTVRGTLGF
nr:LytTR family DNA-binding domain-containing protein [uncultured Bacillus sp.]